MNRLRIGIAGPVSLSLLQYPAGPTSYAGDEYVAPIVAHYVNGLLRRGHEVVVFTTARDLDAPYVIDQDRLVVCVAPRRRPRSVLTFYAPERRDLLAFIERHQPDIVHAMWSYEFALAALQSGRPALVHYRDNARIVYSHERTTYRLLRWMLSEWVSARAPYRIANSEYLKRSFAARGSDMAVLPNFLPADAALPTHAPSSENPYVVTVSNGFRGRKNIAVALRAFDQLRRCGLVEEYRLIGDGLGPGQEAERYAIAEGLDSGVRFLGPVTYADTLRQIAGAEALVHPALEESFGMTVLEAMALGTVVVAGRDAGAVPELLEGGAAGLLCDVESADDLAACLRQALSDADAMAQVKLRARRRFESSYSEEAVLDRLLQLYAIVLQGAP